MNGWQFDLPFDRSSGRYEPQTLVLALRQLSDGNVVLASAEMISGGEGGLLQVEPAPLPAGEARNSIAFSVSVPDDQQQRAQRYASNRDPVRMSFRLRPDKAPEHPGVLHEVEFRLEPNQLELQVEPRPVPADGRVHDLTLTVAGGGLGSAIEGAYLVTLEESKGGNLLESEISIGAGGRAMVRYLSPDLTYERGQSYQEQIVLRPRDGGGALARAPLFLSPGIRDRIEAAKDGLEFEPYELEIPPGQTPARLTGKLVLETATRDPAGELQKEVNPVTDASIVLASRGEHVQWTLVSGEFEFEFPELAEGVAHAPELRERALPENHPGPRCSFDPNTQALFDEYEQKLRTKVPWEVVEPSIRHGLRSYEHVLGRQLASAEQRGVPKVLAGVPLLQTGAAFSGVYKDLSDAEWTHMSNGLGQFFVDLAGWLINVKGFGDWCAENFKALEILEGLENVSFRLVAHLESMLESLRGGSFFGAADKAFMDAIKALDRPITLALVDLRRLTLDRNTVDHVLDVLASVSQALATLLAGVTLGSMDAMAWTLSKAFPNSAMSPDGMSRVYDSYGRHFTRNLAAAGLDPEKFALTGEFLTGKSFEQFWGYVIGATQQTFELIAADPTSWSAQHDETFVASWFLGMDKPISASMPDLISRVESLKFSADPIPSIDRFTDLTIWLHEMSHEAQGNFSAQRFLLDLIDGLLLVFELCVSLFSVAFSGGILTPMTLAFFTAFEVGISAIRAFLVGYPQIVFHGALALRTHIAYVEGASGLGDQ